MGLTGIPVFTRYSESSKLRYVIPFTYRGSQEQGRGFLGSQMRRIHPHSWHFSAFCTEQRVAGDINRTVGITARQPLRAVGATKLIIATLADDP